jgi:HNH endonuclease
VNERLARLVQERANSRCEYCCLPESASFLPFQIDHIVAEKHGGRTVEQNLALACPHCNRYKGPNIAGIESGQLTRLFHPRLDRWGDHFRTEGGSIQGLTEIGRVTVQVLAMNRPDQLVIRVELLVDGLWP